MTSTHQHNRDRHRHRAPGTADKITAYLARTHTARRSNRTGALVLALSSTLAALAIAHNTPTSTAAISGTDVQHSSPVAPAALQRQPTTSRSLDRTTVSGDISANERSTRALATIEQAATNARQARLAARHAAKERAARIAARKAAAAAKAQAAAAQAAARAEATVSQAVAATTPGTVRATARQAMLALGFGSDQWIYLDQLVTRESGWNPHATNAHSGAYGLPQALPGSKMASQGPDWRTNPATQIRWMLKYISERYGNPAGAWAHSQSTGWY